MKVKRKGNGSVCPASVSRGPCRCIDSQTIRIGQICRYVKLCGNPGDLKGKPSTLCAVNNPQRNTAVLEFEAELENSTRKVVAFQSDRSVVQSPKNLNRRDRVQGKSKGCELGFCWETTGVLELSESNTPQVDCVLVPDNCTSVVSVVNSGNISGECRLQVLSLARVAEFE